MTLLQGETVQEQGSNCRATTGDPAIHGFVMRVRGGPHDGRLIQVSADKCTIGRAPNCTVRLVADCFEPLHCLIVRGQGGVIVRRWSDGTTLNGKEFSVSWMIPGDRLGVGPIELELLGDDGGPRPAADNEVGVPLAAASSEASTPVHGVDLSRRESRQLNRRRVHGLCQGLRELRQELEQITAELAGSREAERSAQLNAQDTTEAWESQLAEQVNQVDQLKEELVGAQQFLDQLLGERQEFLAQLGSLQEQLKELNSEQQSGESEQVRALMEQSARLEHETQQLRAERDLMQSVVNELREEVEGVTQLREVWRREREELESRLEQAMSGSDGNSALTSTPYFDGPLPCDEPGDSQLNDGLSSGFEAAEYEHDGEVEGEASEAELLQDALSEGGLPHDRPSILESSGVEVTADDESSDNTPGAMAEFCPELIEGDDAQKSMLFVPEAFRQANGQVGAACLDTQADLERLLVRRASGPRINLSAMRDVANHTARVAIDRHAHRRGLQQAMYKWSIGVSAMFIGGILTQLITTDLILCHVLSAACWVIATWWFFLGSLAYRQAALIPTQRAKSESVEELPVTPADQ